MPSPRKRVDWSEQVKISHNPLGAYHINDFKRQKVKNKAKLPQYKSLKSIDKKSAEKLMHYITKKLDFDRLEECLRDSNFAGKYVSSQELEIIAAKGLLSGKLEKVKKLFDLADKNSKFSPLLLTDEYYKDMVKRKKKQMQKFKNLLLISLIRQGNHDTLQFALSKMEKVSVQDAEIQDGDMVFSSWADTREVIELTAAERLAEAIPKVKIFDTYFEHETPLTAVLKNSESHKKVGGGSGQSMLQLLLDNGADPLEENYQPFKIAARLGLVEDIKIMLAHVKAKYAPKQKLKEGRKHMQTIYVSLLSYAATENNQQVLDLVRSKVDKTGSRQRQSKANKSKPPKFAGVVERSVDKLVKVGLQPNCTYRFRILNGIFNLLNMKQEIEDDEVRKLNQNDLLITPEPQKKQLAPIPFKRARNGILTVNEVVNYEEAYNALQGNNAKGLGAKLNANININAAPRLGDFNSSSSRSVRSYSTTSSISVSGKNKKKALIKPANLHLWLVNILSKNDFYGEQMGMVLFALGLKFYVGTKPSRRKKSGASDAGSTWGYESVASGMESEAEDEDDRGNQSDAMSQKTDNSDDTQSTFSRSQSGRSIGMQKGQKGRRRRKSTLSNVMEFFKETGGKIAELRNNSNKMKSKDKVIILQLAADFGSKKIMTELLNLIAPEVDKNLLKCVYLATIGDKTYTHQTLLDKVNEEFLKIKAAYETPEALAPRLQKGKSIRNVGKQSADGEYFICSIDEFFEEYENFTRVQKNKEQTRQNKKKLAVGKGRSNGARRATLSNAVNGVRRMSQHAKDFVTSKLAGRKTNTFFNPGKKDQSLMGKMRRSITGAAVKKKPPREQQLMERFKRGKRNDLQSKVMKNKANEIMSNTKNNSSGDPLVELNNKYSKFLEKILEIACLYGHFKIAEYTMENKNIDAEPANTVVLDLLRKTVGPHQRKKATEPVLKGLIRLLVRQAQDDTAIPMIARALLDEATKTEPDAIKNLTMCFQCLKEENGRTFMAIKDILFILARSCEGNREWKYWPELINLVYVNLSPGHKMTIDELPSKVKAHKPKLKLTDEVKAALEKIYRGGNRKSMSSAGKGARGSSRNSLKKAWKNGKTSLSRATKRKTKH